MKKVRIKSLPKAQMGVSLTGNSRKLTIPANMGTYMQPKIEVNKTLKPVDEEDANLEAEKGETVVTDLNDDGLPEHYTVGGDRHYDGGTPLNLPGNSFIFSRDRKIKIKDIDIQKMFGMSEKKSGYSPAEIAKKYDINNYRKILADKDTDTTQKKTAELMIKNYNEKLAKLALVQESLKGFPQGIPAIAQPYIATGAFNPTEILMPQGEGENGMGTMKFGGSAYQNTVPEMYPAMYRNGGENGKRIRILNLPKAQAGLEMYPKEFLKNYLNKYQGQDTSGAFPEYLKSGKTKEEMQIAGTQKLRGKNIYGKHDFGSPEMIKDFASRNAWYIKSHPEFNPSKKSDVKDFQEAYNARAEKLGLGKYMKEDGAFGQQTHGAPNLDYVAATEQAPVINNTSNGNGTTPADLPVTHLNTKNSPENNSFWTEDMLKNLGAFGDLGRIHKYLPYQGVFNPVLPQPTFYDPTRELAANAEQASIAASAASMFAGPQGSSARLNQIQSAGAKNAAEILGKYNNLNVGTSNQFETQKTGILNQAGKMKADQATELYDKNVIANQQFDNAKAMVKQNLRQSFIDAWSNRGKTQALNSTQKQYRVDPTTGFVEFTGGKDVVPAKQSKELQDKFEEFMQNPNLAQHPEIAYKMALHSMGVVE